VVTACREPVEDSEQWAVLHVDGSPPDINVEPFAVIDRWHGDDTIMITCRGERVFTSAHCIDGGAAGPVEVTYRGHRIATTTEFELLGFLD
jgi:hypothetical protein